MQHQAVGAFFAAGCQPKVLTSRCPEPRVQTSPFRGWC